MYLNITMNKEINNSSYNIEDEGKGTLLKMIKYFLN